MTDTTDAPASGKTKSKANGAAQRKGLKVSRVWTTEGTHPYDEVTWEHRDVVMTNWRDGSINFEQRGVEFPEFWSVNATNIVTSKYFRGAVGTEQRESSLKQLLDRVVKTYRAAGEQDGYFATTNDAQVFEEELTWLLLHQYFSFNSPVWFNVGTPDPQQVSACQPYDSLVSTPAGLVPIGKLVDNNAIGTKVYDAHGLTKILAVKANGTKDVLRLHTKAGYTLDVTADHLVWKASGQGTGSFVDAGSLQMGDQLQWHRREANGDSQTTMREIYEARLAGWLQSDGFVGQYDEGTNRSLTIEAITVTDEERNWVQEAIGHVFPDVHSHERRVETQDKSLDCRRTRLYGEDLRPFVEKWGLLDRGTTMRVPERLYTAQLHEVHGYLASIFQAEGYVSARERSTLVAADMISEELIRGVQRLLLRFGIFSRVSTKHDKRANRHDIWTVRIQSDGDRDLFSAHIGFLSADKIRKLEASFDKAGRPARDTKLLQVAKIEKLGPMEVYDIQTESGEYLSGNLRVHNCFILSVDDTVDSILNWYREEGLIFKGGSGAGLNLSRIRASKELLSSGGNASGPVSFMRGADASAGTIKSGGATRRAAKMVILDVDHPDIEEFIDTKAREEDKIRALRDAGFDMDLGGKDIVSVQYQNANNSVRVTDEFMRAVENKTDYALKARLDGSELERLDAKSVFHKMAKAAWECADPGIQFDDSINDWHTNPETGRITASNPCFPADQRVVTDKGLIRIGDLVQRSAAGEKFAVYTNDVTSESDATARVLATNPTRYMVTGTNPIVKLEFSDGSMLRCTPNHRVWTTNRGWAHADELTRDDRIVRSFHYAPRSMASWELPKAAVTAAERAVTSKKHNRLTLPEKWDSEFAHYLGWLVGDGSLTDISTVTVYGTDEEQRELLPRHSKVLTSLTRTESKPSLQSNGTVQLRNGATALRSFLSALGVSSSKSSGKVVPEAIFDAPEEVMIDFLQGLFDADGCAVELENGTRYVGVASRSKELLRGVQELLASLGIAGRIYDTGVKKDSFAYTRKDGSQVSYSSDGPMYDLRISGRSMREFAALISFSLVSKRDKLMAMTDFRSVYNKDESVWMVSREDDGFETTYNLTEPRNHSYIVGATVVANCSEYMHIDNSSCNLASLNLMKFRNDDGSFDVDKFTKAVEFVITAMEISISFADFPTEAITKNTKAHRQLGIGYANLGALLMASGFAYDSDEGRAVAAGITSLMSGVSYRRSAELAGVVGPYDAYALNADAHKRVMRKHAAACDNVKTYGVMDRDILTAATAEWQQGNKIGDKNGWRNSQSSVIAPTGTIGFMMDCDTTGIEPDLALVKFKKLVGGGSMQIVNQTVPRALETLGYQPESIEAITEYIAEHGHVVDAPGLRPDHYPVFDCAMGERSISAMGHVKMMAAAQPFVSGAISKTVNVPESATVEDFEEIYFESWKLGLKALAVYRENSKVGQPLSVSKKDSEEAEPEKVVEYRPIRNRLPKKRPSQTVSFSVGGAEGYMTSSSYPDNGLGEVFFKMSKQGSTLAGIMDAFSVAISIALQYGVPLEKYVEKFTNMRFEPAGMTDDPDIRIAASVVDYLFRRLALDYLPFETRSDLGILTSAERAAEVRGEDPASVDSGEDEIDFAALAASAPIEKVVQKLVEQSPQVARSSTEVLESLQGKGADAPLCMTCGTKMRPAGSCYVCEGCGSTSGCS